MKDSEANLAPLPRPTVKYLTDPNEISEATARGMMSNPIYVGVPPYRRIVSDEAWIRTATELIREEGAEQFLVNMLYMLRTSIVDAIPDEAIPEDYDGPWPDDEEEEPFEADSEDEEEGPSPWQHPMEGYIYCSHDNFPMLVIDNEFICIGEYLYTHINNSPVNDLITGPVLSLVFQNGHTLPLLCPDCGESLHITDQNALLDDISGQTIINIEWDGDTEELILEFGEPLDEEDDEDESEVVSTLAVHLDSVRGLTCPYKNLWHDEEE